MPTKIRIDLFPPGLNTREAFILKLVNLVTYTNDLLQLSSVKGLYKEKHHFHYSGAC